MAYIDKSKQEFKLGIIHKYVFFNNKLEFPTDKLELIRF